MSSVSAVHGSSDFSLGPVLGGSSLGKTPVDKSSPPKLPDLPRTVEFIEGRGGQSVSFEVFPDLVLAPTSQATTTAKRLFGDNGEFEILELLGTGGMGNVYKARDTRTDNIVAIKICIRTDQKALARTEREGEISRLKHSNILRTIGSGSHQGHNYIVMELANGGTLKDRIDLKRLPLSGSELNQSLVILFYILDALIHSHSKGVVHRDIKPGNILFLNDVPKLADFGMATDVGESVNLTVTGDGIGTPSYMAPEQVVNAKKADARSDLYSIGAIMYELLTGHPPFTGTSATEVMNKVLYEKHLPLGEQVPSKLATIVNKLLDKDPKRRYESAEYLQRELLEYLTNKPMIKGPRSLRSNRTAA